MGELHTAPTSSLTPEFLADLRTFLSAAFDGEFSDDDWAHTIGGLHVWSSNAHGVISHASIVERTLTCSGHTLRAAYVEAVATSPDHRRKGHATAIMTRVGALIREGHVLGALSTGAHAFYESLGWERWPGPTFVAGRNARKRTADDDGGVMILRTARTPRLDLDAAIVCDWRPGDVW